MLQTERILPTGLWKGSALSIVLGLAAAILSGGNVRVSPLMISAASPTALV